MEEYRTFCRKIYLACACGSEWNIRPAGIHQKAPARQASFTSTLKRIFRSELQHMAVIIYNNCAIAR
jgi:hypothetical protein